MSERIVNVHSTNYNGRHFRSSLEAQTAKVLDELNIQYQYEEKKIELVEGFRCPYQKDKVRAITYCPDFIIGPIMLECKGFETPEWKLKKKLVYQWLMKNEPKTLFYQLHDAKKSLLGMLDKHWKDLGYAIMVTKKPSKKQKEITKLWFDSVAQALENLNLQGKSTGAVLSALTGKKEYVFGYKWTLINLHKLI